MSNELPAGIAAVVERITVPPTPATELPTEVTGELRALLTWWSSVSAGAAPNATVIESGTGDWPTASEAMASGIAAAERAVDAGATVLVPRATVRDDTTARSLVAVLTRLDPSTVVPQPEGMTDRTWMAIVATVRDDAFRLTPERGDSVALLDSAGAATIGFVAGVLLGAAARQTPCLIDGTDELCAALVADRMSARARGWWTAGSQSPDPARRAAADRIAFAPGLPLALTDNRGLGAQTTLEVLRLLAETGPSTVGTDGDDGTDDQARQ